MNHLRSIKRPVNEASAFFIPRTRLSRRSFLRATGVTLALPLLEAMCPAFGAMPAGRGAAAVKPRRMVNICTALGLHAPFLFPQRAGRDYLATPYLEPLAGFRDQFTLCSGLSHPGVDGGHASEASFLTAAPHPHHGSFVNGISLDQFAAEHMGSETRFPYLALGTSEYSLSWTRSGVRLPAESSPSRLFARLFLNGTAEEVERQVQRVKEGRTILDNVREQVRHLERELGKRDQAKLDQYFAAVRELEQRLVRGEEWARTPKPRVSVPPLRDITDTADLAGRTRLMYDLIHLALQTDSTRLITLHIAGTFQVPPIPGVSIDWHNLSHHGKDPRRIEELKRIELLEMKLFASLLAKLQGTSEAEGTLLDRTMVLFGSNLGNASSHDTKNLPVILAGGGFQHGQYLAFNAENNAPLCNLYVSMLQRLDVEVNAFATGNRTLSGLSPLG